MKVILFDPSHRHLFFPFTLTRTVADLRIGVGTIRETWEKITGTSPVPLSVSYLTGPLVPDGESGLFINAALLPDTEAWKELAACALGEALFQEDRLIAFHVPLKTDITLESFPALAASLRPRALHKPYTILEYPWQLVQLNDAAIRRGLPLFTEGRTSAPIPAGNQVSGAVFLEEGARVSCSVLNASTGPIYIGKHAEIMEGCLIRGPLVLGEGAVLKMGTKVYGGCTIGPYSVAGGELKNVIMMGYSNKGHDGYLGDALIGEWCNLGAGTSNSNVRNNATNVRVWNPGIGKAVDAGLKAGLFMGDYSRAAIQTAFNTGAVVGVCCNVFGGGVCSGYVPDFSWGASDPSSAAGAAGPSSGRRYEWDKVLRDIANWKKLKGQTLEEREIQILRHIFGSEN